MELQKFNRALFGAMVISGAMGIASQAHALNITPAGPGLVATPSGLPANSLNADDVELLLGLNFDWVACKSRMSLFLLCFLIMKVVTVQVITPLHSMVISRVGRFPGMARSLLTARPAIWW